MKSRVYISGPITGCEDYEKKFRKAEEDLTNKGYEVVNPAYLSKVMPNATHVQYMRICIPLMDECNAIYLLEGWDLSHGASIEYGYALGRDMMVFREGDFDK